MQYNRDFKTTGYQSTIAQWVDAYNNNALASSDMMFMMGEATFTAVLYTGLETIGNGINAYKIKPFKDISVDFNAVFPDNLVLDNWYVYFRNINKFILISQLHVDLTDYSKYDNDEFVQGDLYHFFINYQLGYRISHSPIPKEGETRLFRFIATGSNISQLIPTFARYFYAGNNVDYEDITGLDVTPVNVANLGLNDGWVDYDGINFDYHPIPDKKYYNEVYVDGFIINKAGNSYVVDDVIPTNEPGKHLRITEVFNECNDSNVWQSAKEYVTGEVVYYDSYTWTALQTNTGKAPGTTSDWRKDQVAGSIVNGEITTDALQISFYGNGADIEIGKSTTPWDLMYNTSTNKLDYSDKTKAVDGSQIMNYQTGEITALPAGKFSIQRVHLDYLTDTLVIQYGNRSFDTMREAVDAVYSLSFPFVYNTYIFPVLAYMIVQSDYTDLKDSDQCQIIQVHTRSIDIRETENLANDSYARALLSQHGKQIQILNDWLTRLQADFDTLRTEFDMHISNNLPTPTSIKSGSNQNPHRVTKAEVGLGEVDNVAMKNMPVPATGGTTGLVHVREAIDQCLSTSKAYTDTSTAGALTTAGQRFLYKDRNDSTNSGVITVINDIRTRSKFIKFQANGYNDNSGYNWYVGELPGGIPCESYGVKRS